MKRLAGLLAIGLATLAAALATEAPAAGRVAWQERIREATAAVEQAEARRSAAEDAYDEMRHRKYPRGEARAAVEAERTAARAAVAETQQQLDALLAEARSEGVPPGWVRRAQAEDADAEPADAAAADDDIEPAVRANLPFDKPAADE
jgi:hypothetical protein